jgi:4'-phosphopantetheinyl transferase
MKNESFIKKHSVHLWWVFVPELLAHVEQFSQILSVEEMNRALRFRFDVHRQRYIIARSVLRQILQLYTGRSAQDIVFLHGERGKPYLQDNPLDLQFNVSHSHDMAVYAFTTQAEIGVDIEKIESHFSDGVAERFFSKDECGRLFELQKDLQTAAFYHLWAGKEAIIKALGEGLFVPLTSFSLDLHQQKQKIMLQHHAHEHVFHLEYFIAHSDYQSAFATAQSVEYIHNRQWTTDHKSL